jgi:hypothetical protein
VTPEQAAGLAALLDIASRISVTGGFMLALLATYRGWVVPGWLYRQVKAERDEALEMVKSLAETTLRAATAAEHAGQK